MCTNLGGRGESGGLGNGSIYQKLDIPQDTAKTRFDASKLEGTEKQIAYAQSIIDDAYITADAEIRRAMDAVEYYNKNGDSIEQLAYSAAKVRVWTESKKKLEETLIKAKTASGIIRNKEIIKSVLPSIRQSLEEKYRKEYENKYRKIFRKK